MEQALPLVVEHTVETTVPTVVEQTISHPVVIEKTTVTHPVAVEQSVLVEQVTSVEPVTHVTVPPTVIERPIPGKKKTFKKHLIEKSCHALQSFTPVVRQTDLHLCGFAFYNGEPHRQVELQHYCNTVNDEFTQCVIYDSPKEDAKLVGVEYIISQRLFDSLPHEERKYWHSHLYDVQSGSLFAPGLPRMSEDLAAKNLANTYGKTWLLWQFDRGHSLPLGPPQLMMVATKAGMWDEKLFDDREHRIKYKKEKVRNRRSNIVGIPNPAADHWQHEEPIQCTMVPFSSTVATIIPSSPS